MNHANRICLDWLGGDSGAAGTVGDQQRSAQWRGWETKGLWLVVLTHAAVSWILWALFGPKGVNRATHAAEHGKAKTESEKTGARGAILLAGVKPPVS